MAMRQWWTTRGARLGSVVVASVRDGGSRQVWNKVRGVQAKVCFRLGRVGKGSGWRMDEMTMAVCSTGMTVWKEDVQVCQPLLSGSEAKSTPLDTCMVI
jgi:hypothetical protein